MPVSSDGFSSFAFLIDPDSAECGDGLGISISDVRIGLGVESGGSFTIAASVLEAVDSGAGCFVPGALLESTPPRTISGWPDLGGLDVGTSEMSHCFARGYQYFLVVEFVSIDAEVLVPRTSSNLACTSFANQGESWVDLQTIGDGGGLVIYCQASGCDTPTEAQSASWGTLKATFVP